MSKIAISQPTYLCWLGYLQQIAQVDCFVFLDNVQFEKQSWQSRNRIKDQRDHIIWLSVPVSSHSLDAKVSEIELAKQRANWHRKHLTSIKTCLAKTPYLNPVLALLEEVFSEPFTNLADLNIELTLTVCRKLGITTPFLRASELNVQGSKADLLLEIIKKLNASSYYANQGSKSYLELEKDKFLDNGVTIKYQDWQHPIYKQCGNDFISHLAWPDAICYQGFDAKKLQLI